MARARSVKRDFEPDDVASIDALVKLLDGLPLAIELAAARVRVLKVRQIAERLSDRFRLLRGGSTTERRHRTLRETIDWSHDLLSESERALFRRQGVFARGWTLGAAEEICVGDGVEKDDVLDLLTTLVDKSLVVVERGGEEARYSYLESVGEYARERLREAGEEETYRRRHLDHFLAVSQRGDKMLEGPEQREWLSQSRAQVLRRGLEALRQAAGDETVLLGCGCPLGSAIGLVDAMRIAPDVSPRWLPNILNIPRFFDTETGLPSTRNTIHNALTRANLHRGWWINGPDCLLLREETELCQAEMQTLATVIALTGSQFLLSDDLSALSPERLRIAQALIPVLQNSARILDWFDRATPSQLRLDLSGPAGDWHMLALFNWDDQPCRTKLDVQDFRLQPNRHYLAREFWSGQIIEIDQFVDFDLGAHGTALLAVRPSDPESPAYLGSDLHLSQGLEVVQWQSSQDRLLFVIQRPLHCKGNIFLYIPWQSYAVKVDEQDLKPINEEGYCRLPITCQQGSVSIEIQKT